MTKRLGPERAMLAVVLAGALVTYGRVSLFVAFFVLVPMAQALLRAAVIRQRLMPAAIALGTSTFSMSALPGTPAIQNDPDAVLRHRAVCSTKALPGCGAAGSARGRSSACCVSRRAGDDGGSVPPARDQRADLLPVEGEPQ
jgi:hypothetical protein